MKITQKQRVADKLKADGFVDNFWAMETKTTIRLGAIIFELKAEGYLFDEVKSGFVEGTKNWRYFLLVGARQPHMPKFRYEQLADGSMREVAIAYA